MPYNADMKVTVFGANGKVGSLVIAKLLENGHDVTAFVYGKHALPQNEKLTVYQGNVKVADDVEMALKGTTAVISTLGSWGTSTKDILSEGMRIIIPIMEQQGIKRIVSLTGSAACTPGEKLSLPGKMARQLLYRIAPKILDDAEKHIVSLATSDLEWTVLRSPVMNNLGRKTYRLDNLLPSMLATINRKAVASALIDILESGKYIHEAPHIHRI